MEVTENEAEYVEDRDDSRETPSEFDLTVVKVVVVLVDDPKTPVKLGSMDRIRVE